MCGGEVAGGRQCGHPLDWASCSRQTGFQQCKSFVMCGGGCNLGLPSSLFALQS
jgi:hypothetical protein